ncbi:MAG: sigma-70 family RNA polymerase sigma factor [Gemmatimonadota bacterium]|nr:sigma-70 family RNA polymerase sigma factor [Gemmatimonadota bacterium]
MNSRGEDPRRTAGIRRRDPETLEQVARENSEILFRGAKSAGFPDDDAHDLVQETFLVLVRKADQFDGRAKVRTWLYGVLLRKIADSRRSRWREVGVEAIDLVMDARFDADGSWIHPPEPPDSYAAGRQALDWLADCLGQLPRRSREAFALREVEMLEVQEICKRLALSPNNLGVVLFRTRNSLRECMEMKGIWGSADVDV